MVFPTDSWIAPIDNHVRFQSVGITDKTVPISVDVTKALLCVNGYFSLLFVVDALS